MQGSHDTSPLDTLIAQLESIAARYSTQPWQLPATTAQTATDATQETQQDVQQEASELADAVAQADRTVRYDSPSRLVL